MGQLLVRQLDDDVKEALQRRAQLHGRSMEEEVREILRQAVGSDQSRPVKLGSAIAARFQGTGLPEDVVELRGSRVQPADLDEA